MQKIIKLFVFWRISLFFLTYLGSIIFAKVANGGIGAIGPGHNFDFWASWAQWDGGNYYYIAKYGYASPNLYAFFPLYPVLIKLTSYLFFGNVLLSGLIVANLFALTFFIILFQLVKIKFNEKLAYLSIITFLTFPTSYFLGAMYSESLFVLLVVLALLALEKKRFFWAGAAASLAAITRVVGVFLVFAIIWSYLQSIDFDFKKINYKILAIPLSITSIAAYCAYLYHNFKDPFYFFSVQQTWHRSLTNPFITIYSYLSQNLASKPFNDYLDVAVTVLFLILLVWGVKKIPIGWWLFATLTIVIPASTSTLTSMPRYALSSVPTFIIMADLLKNNQLLQILIWGSFLVIQVALAIMFVNGYWTA